MYIFNLGVHICAFSGIAPNKIAIPDLLLSKWKIVEFML